MAESQKPQKLTLSRGNERLVLHVVEVAQDGDRCTVRASIGDGYSHLLTVHPTDGGFLVEHGGHPAVRSFIEDLAGRRIVTATPDDEVSGHVAPVRWEVDSDGDDVEGHGPRTVIAAVSIAAAAAIAAMPSGPSVGGTGTSGPSVPSVQPAPHGQPAPAAQPEERRLPGHCWAC